MDKPSTEVGRGKRHPVQHREMKEGDIWCSMRQDTWFRYCKSHDVTEYAGVEILLSFSMFAIH